jgi:ferredoxin
VRVEVDREACRTHGQCTIAAPEVFSFDAAGELVYVAEPDEGLRVVAEDAMDACPEQAITLLD